MYNLKWPFYVKYRYYGPGSQVPFVLVVLEFLSSVGFEPHPPLLQPHCVCHSAGHFVHYEQWERWHSDRRCEKINAQEIKAKTKKLLAELEKCVRNVLVKSCV